MNLPVQYNLNHIKPQHFMLHSVLDNILSMTTGLCASKMSFILLWEEGFHAAHHHTQGIKSFQSTDFSVYKDRFSKINAACFYAPNTKYHTLFQDLYFFKLYEQYPKVLVFPIFDNNQQMCGLIGVLHPENPSSIDQNKHALKELSLYTAKLRLENVMERVNLQPKPTLIQSLNQLPGAHFELIISTDGQLALPSVSQELIQMHPHFWEIEHQTSPEAIFKILHLMDFQDFRAYLLNKELSSPIEFSYALKEDSEIRKYYMVRINTYLNDAGETLCFGAVKDISLQKAYENVLEQINFDISHVMRRPVATMQGLTQLIELDKMNRETVKEVASKLQLVSNEMDTFIKKLYTDYQKRWEDLDKESQFN
ncbi:hypothetical protein JKA74_20525 [Marivirga sp. S37H4]|uniref:PAC domain-containing protein n=1 Tax=Marivirga aurantiaca TaxID=2802615 RepID=A0A934X1U0_9BACT|nr:hypothetical protein [Marivirga aurantiaca]MBK6267438.1 hypothetical protein [Marivirga aurantiaca]